MQNIKDFDVSQVTAILKSLGCDVNFVNLTSPQITRGYIHDCEWMYIGSINLVGGKICESSPVKWYNCDRDSNIINHFNDAIGIKYETLGVPDDVPAPDIIQYSECGDGSPEMSQSPHSRLFCVVVAFVAGLCLAGSLLT